jgi:transposase
MLDAGSQPFGNPIALHAQLLELREQLAREQRRGQEQTGAFEKQTQLLEKQAQALEEQARALKEKDKAIEDQSQILKEQKEALGEREQHIQQLLDYITLLKRKRFGPSADRIPADQLKLFDEAELEALIAELEEGLEEPTTPESKPSTPEKPKAKPRRRPLPEHLPRVERVIDLPEAQKQAMGSQWTFIGYDESEQLAVIPRQPYVIRFKRAKYVPLNEEVPGAEQGVVIAPRAAQILPKAIGHSSLIADVVVGKFVDALPLYRQEKIFAREGIDISRQTMAGWMIALDGKLAPLMAAMKAVLYQGRVIHIDETRLQVLKEPGREATQQSFMWVYRGGPPGRAVLWFQYAETRSGEVPRAFLFPGGAVAATGSDPPPRFYLLSDGYSAYNALAREAGIVGHAACFAHVRRKFVEAAAGRKNTAAAHQMVALVGQLYAVERTLRDRSPAERKAAREVRSKPILDKIKAWLDAKAPKVLPKGLLGQAIAYTLGLWPQLTTFLEDGHIPIDNNLAENAIRPFVVGRKNFLFSGSPRGAHASATLYSLIETAKANGLEPRAYLTFLFERLPVARTPEALDALLPQNLTNDDLKLETPKL